MWAWPNIELCNGRSLNVIPGKTATVARIFRPFMPSSIKTQDIKVVFVRFLHVCVSLFLHFVKTGTNSPTGTPPGQQAMSRPNRDSWQLWDGPDNEQYIAVLIRHMHVSSCQTDDVKT